MSCTELCLSDVIFSRAVWNVVMKDDVISVTEVSLSPKVSRPNIKCNIGGTEIKAWQFLSLTNT